MSSGTSIQTRNLATQHRNALDNHAQEVCNKSDPEESSPKNEEPSLRKCCNGWQTLSSMEQIVTRSDATEILQIAPYIDTTIHHDEDTAFGAGKALQQALCHDLHIWKAKA